MGRSTTKARRSLLIAVTLGLLLVACSNASDGGSKDTTTTTSGSGGSTTSGDNPKITGVPGVSDTEIKFSSLGTNSNNPLGTCVLDCFSDGIQAYFDFRNSEGGIYGRKLVLSERVDDALSANQAKAKEIVSANDTFGTFSAAQIASGWGDLAKAGIPTYVWTINPAEMTGHPEIFGNREVVCIICTSRAVAYAAKLAKAKTVATLGYGVSENSKQCAQSNVKSIEKYGDDVGGVKVGYTNDNLAFGLPNGIGPEVTAMKNADVDLVFVCLDLNGAKTLAQEMQRQGVRDTMAIYHTNTYDQKFVKDAGSLFDGDYIGVGFRPFEADAGTSGLADFKTWMDKQGKDITEIALDGWINADLAYQGLEGAGSNFDRAKVIAATNKLTAFTAGGLTMPVDWGRQHEPPTEADPVTHGAKQDCFSLVHVEDGDFELVGDAAKPFICWPGDTRDWSEPTNTDFK